MKKLSTAKVHMTPGGMVDGPTDDLEGESLDGYSIDGFYNHCRNVDRRKKLLRNQPKASMKSQYSMQSVRFRWRRTRRVLVSMKSEYEGDQRIGIIILFLQFLRTGVTVWWRGFTVSTRLMRKIVIICIGVMIFLGLLFTMAGVFKMTRYEENEHTLDFYWAITLVALVVLTLAVTGSIGIFRPNVMVMEIFAMASFVFGHLIFAIVISWYLLVSLDKYLSTTYFADVNDTRQKKVVNDVQIYEDEFLQLYFKLLIVISIIMMTAGVITTKLLIKIRRNQGYLTILKDSTPAIAK